MTARYALAGARLIDLARAESGVQLQQLHLTLASPAPPTQQVILSLRRALRQAGAAEAELRRCLAPVDLAGEHQLYRRADT